MTFFERMDETIRRSPVWTSLFRQPYPRDERTRAMAVLHRPVPRYSGILVSAIRES